MDRYVGLTIGPIYKTIENARSTGELWGSSYLFSYLIREMIQELRPISSLFITPYVPEFNSDLFTTKNEVGFFPDRIIFKLKCDIEEPLPFVQKIRDRVLSKFSSNIAQTLNEEEEDVWQYVCQYIRIYGVLYEADDSCEILKEINRRLDTIELYEQPIPSQEKNYIASLIKNTTIKKSFLYEDAFGSEQNKIKKLPMIHHIAINGVEKKIDCIEQETQKHVLRQVDEFLKDEFDGKSMELKKHLENNDDAFQALTTWLEKKGAKYSLSEDINAILFDYYNIFFSIFQKNASNPQLSPEQKFFRYVCLVKADGDNIGSTISKLKAGQNSKITELSKQLFEFGQYSAKRIKDYGGFPVYVGGDDLLFFSPTVSLIDGNVLTVFDLIKDLSDLFKSSFEGLTLSFGISVIYCKYPLYEGLKKSEELLADAKKYVCYTNNSAKQKNAISLSLLKHSGSGFDVIFNQDSLSLKIFLNILKKSLSGNIMNLQNEDILSSIMHRLSLDKALLSQVLCQYKDTSSLKSHVQYYLENTFNEAIHKTDGVLELLSSTKEMICAFHLEETNADSQNLNLKNQENTQVSTASKAIDRVIACLSLIKFLHEKGGEK